jgi:hypothetical protein
MRRRTGTTAEGKWWMMQGKTVGYVLDDAGMCCKGVDGEG